LYIRVADCWVLGDKMEKIIILAIVFTSIGLLVWNVIRSFKGKNSCCDCGNVEVCMKDGCSK
jgi:hypothetical protein